MRQLSPRSVDKKTLASLSAGTELDEEPPVKEVVEIEQAELKITSPKSKEANFKLRFKFLNIYLLQIYQ